VAQQRRGMEAVAAKSARRTPVFTRRRAADAMPDDAEVPPPPMPSADVLECPKCGAELVDTPQNRAYVGERATMLDEDAD
jgi:hypothetical protein